MGKRETTVLFADVSDSSRLYETAGDAAASEAISKCLGRLREAAESGGGRVVKTIGDEIMVLFPSPNSAAASAAAMHAATEALPAVGETKLGLRIGFHCGPVVQRDDDVYGETVNLASRLTEQAVKGQIITSEETVRRLGTELRTWSRALYRVQIKGMAEDVGLCEMLWRPNDALATFSGFGPKDRRVRATLRVRHGVREIIRRRESDVVVLGRDETCELVIDSPLASRQHCTIERRQDKYVVRDHSTNGTFVRAADDTEILLRREETILRGHGWISCGTPTAENPSPVEFFCS